LRAISKMAANEAGGRAKTDDVAGPSRSTIGPHSGPDPLGMPDRRTLRAHGSWARKIPLPTESVHHGGWTTLTSIAIRVKRTARYGDVSLNRRQELGTVGNLKRIELKTIKTAPMRAAAIRVT